jgi:hypothetical protein
MHVLSAMPGLDTKMVPSSTMREFLLRCRIPQQTSSPIGNIWAAHTSNSTSTLPKKNPPRSLITKASEFSPYPFFSYFFFLTFSFYLKLFLSVFLDIILELVAFWGSSENGVIFFVDFLGGSGFLHFTF